MNLSDHTSIPAVIVVLASALFGAVDTSEAAKAARAAPPKSPPAATTKGGGTALVAGTTDVEPAGKIIRYGEKDVVRVKTKIRFTTLIVLPKSEQILDFTCGDKEFWVVNGVQNFAYVKPAKVGAQTNLNLVTASGNIYSFTLYEISEEAKAEPDLKLFIEPKEESMITSAAAAPRFVAANVLDDYRRQVELAKDETAKAKAASQEIVDRGITKFISNVRFPYRFEAGKKPFGVRAMYHDDKFTYIQARPEEAPTLYEIKDGKPNLVNFEFKNGLYTVGKILRRGYLAIGKQKLPFESEE